MDIIVCVKRVPDTAGAEVVIDKDGRRIREEGLVFDMNDWDKYAVEEAVLLKERYGGTVTAIALGPEGVADTLRRCFVTGCDDGYTHRRVNIDFLAAKVGHGRPLGGGNPNSARQDGAVCLGVLAGMANVFSCECRLAGFEESDCVIKLLGILAFDDGFGPLGDDCSSENANHRATLHLRRWGPGNTFATD